MVFNDILSIFVIVAGRLLSDTDFTLLVSVSFRIFSALRGSQTSVNMCLSLEKLGLRFNIRLGAFI